MRTSLVFCTILLLLTHHVAGAQNQTAYELQHQVAETERQAVIGVNLPLLDSEAEEFWALYLKYRTATKEMDDKRLNLIRRFANAMEDLSSDEGKRLVLDALRVEKKRQALKERYLKKFARLLPGQRFFRYYQIETKLDAMQRFDWTQQIPLAPVTE